MKLHFVSVVIVILFTGCDKSLQDPLIDSSNISLTNETLDVLISEEYPLFKSSATYKSFFAASGIQLDDSLSLIISTRSISSHDFEAGDLVRRWISNEQFGKDMQAETDDIFQENDAGLNVVSPNIYKIKDELHVVYLKQEAYNSSDIFLKRSFDNGRTWNEEQKINLLNAFHIIMNNSVCVTSTNRIIIAAAHTPNIIKEYNSQRITCYYSDDFGRTWKTSTVLDAKTPLMEPSVTEIDRGHLLMVIRSTHGKLLFSESMDNGATWAKIKKSKIDSPASTALLYKIGINKIALVWNNNLPGVHVFDRNPLALSVSSDGVHWSKPFIIASQEGAMYSSPTLFKINSKWVLIYNKSVNTSEYDLVYKILEF